MAENNDNRRVAIACQGGGSHTAFTAGVLKKLLMEKAEGKHDYEVVALSGTSGGAICALLSWYGLLMNDTNRAVELLDSFWSDNSASSLQDKLVNDWLLWTNRFFESTGGMPTISPYYYPSRGQDLLRSMLEKHVDFGRINDLVKQSSPLLLVGAANVLSGEFQAFRSHRDKINADMILASAAIPTLFGPCTRTGACTGTACSRKTHRARASRCRTEIERDLGNTDKLGDERIGAEVDAQHNGQA